MSQSPGSYRVCVLAPPGYQHTGVYLELAFLVKCSIADLGADCDLAVNEMAEDRVNIVIGYHLLNRDAAGFLKHYQHVIYQLEQLSDGDGTFTVDRRKLLESAGEVWDFAEENVAFLARHGIGARHVLPGYHTALRQFSLKPPDQRDIDVLFYGSMNDRRQRVVDQLEAAGANVVVGRGVYGKKRNELIARSKIVLNLHFYQAQLFESVRVSYLLNNGAFVVSETATHCPYRGTGLSIVPYDTIVDTCEEWLAQDEQRLTLQGKNAESFALNYRMTDMLSGAIRS